MNNSLRCQLVYTVLSLLQLNVYSHLQPLQTSSENDVKAQLPKDFIRFLESLDPNKYETKHKIVTNYREETTAKSNNARKSVVTAQMTQKKALRDVPMMQLVSYYEDKFRISSHRDRHITPQYDRALPMLYYENQNRITNHDDIDSLSSKPYERDTLTSRAGYEDNKYMMHHYGTVIPTTSVEISNNNIAINMIPRRTLDISDASKDSSDKNSAAEVIIL